MRDSLPFITCLCPTYHRPALVQQSYEWFLAQDYPLDRRLLLILDDGGTFAEHTLPGVQVISQSVRCPGLAAKYNQMLDLIPPWTDLVAVWEDDDHYQTGYLRSHVDALAAAPLCQWSKPSTVLSDYTGEVLPENAAGRFHASLVFRRDFIRAMGGWVETDRADFDQQLIQRAFLLGGQPADPCLHAPPQYLFRWGSTGHSHAQHLMGNDPGDTDWYARHVQPPGDQTLLLRCPLESQP